MRFRSTIAAGLGLTLLLAILTGLFAYTYLGAGARSRAWVDHTRQVIDLNQSLFSLVQDAESSERGYLLTEEPQYLRPFRVAQARTPVIGAALAALVSDNPDETARANELNGLISRKMRRQDALVAMGGDGRFEEARALARRDDGRQMMADIRSRSYAISLVERRLLEQRIAALLRDRELNLFLGLALAATAMIGLLGLVVILARSNRRLKAAMAEARAAQAARDASDALVKAMFANASDYLYVLEVGENGRFVLGAVNPAFEKAFNVASQAVLGRSIADLVPAETAERLLTHFRRVAELGRPVLTRDTLAVPDGPQGGVRTWETLLAPVTDAHGRTDRIVGAIRDITTRLRTEDRLREAQRMEAVGQLTGGLAHDFNNLLQVIRGNLELLESTVAADPKSRRRLAAAIHGADRAAQLTRQLLAFARRQPLEPKVINLSRLVGDMTELMRRTLGENIEVETIVGGGLWNTLADPAQVESAILNLALNARDAMPGGGRLTVEITNASLDEAYVRRSEGLTPGQYVMIAVSDTGEGMDEAVRKRAVEPFFTTKAEGRGSGLGLAMVYGFARQSNGHIQVYSEPGQGTTVRIYLPRSRDPVAAANETLLPAARGSRQTILVVEDEPDVRAAAVATLEDLGYRCLEAEDAEAALARLAAGAKVDLVFSDVMMPGAVRGREFAERLKDLAPGTPILFTSGYTENAIVHHGRLDEGLSLLSKPYAREELARRVAQLLLEAALQPPESAKPG